MLLESQILPKPLAKRLILNFFHQSFLSRNVSVSRRAIGHDVINGRSQRTAQGQFNSVRERAQCIASSTGGGSLGSGMSGGRSAGFINWTRRCGSKYLGVVVLRLWYFWHALFLLKNCHHILPEKINPSLYFFAEPHSLYSMFQSTTKTLSLHGNVLKCTSSTQTCSEPNCNIRRTPVLTARTVGFISAPLILTLWGRSTGITCLFTPITLYSVFQLLTRADKVPEVQYPQLRIYNRVTYCKIGSREARVTAAEEWKAFLTSLNTLNASQCFSMIRNAFLTFPMSACTFVKPMRNDQYIGNVSIFLRDDRKR